MNAFEAEKFYWAQFNRFELLIPGWMILESNGLNVPDRFVEMVRRPERCTKQAIADELASYSDDVDVEEEADNWKHIVQGGILDVCDSDPEDCLAEFELPELPAGITPPFMEDVNCARGAPMGRTNQVVSVEPDRGLFMVRVPFQGDAYDPGGAYWGLPSNLWCVFSHDHELVIYVRATYPEEAIEQVKKQHGLSNEIRQHVWHLPEET